MRKIGLLFLLLAIGTIAFSQEITVRFTGQLNGTDYCRLDSVKVTNLTRNWTETVESPDTIIVLGSTVGTNLNIAATQGLGQNVPNPFDCETRVELSVSQRENVRMQLLDASGKQYAEYSGSLNAGVHIFDISAASPQTYILNAVVGNKTYSIRMINMGIGCGNSIKYAGISGCITAKLTSTNEFQTGDNMRYVGYAIVEGNLVTSDAVEQMQAVSQYVTLNFTHHFRPIVETSSATDITTTSATLNGNITFNGGTEITARGFYYGTRADNLSQTLSSGIGDGAYSAELVGLANGTTYYYCAFAQNNVGITTGTIMNFTTITVTAPSVETMAVTEITRTTATLNGNIVSDGNSSIISRGFRYGTTADNLENNILAGIGMGEYSANLSDLEVATTYYYCAFATNNAGTVTGEIMSFTTNDISLPTVITLDASNIGLTTATLNASITDDGGDAVTSRGFFYGLNPENLAYQVVSDATDMDFSSIVSLNMYTPYYYKAYATNSAGTTIGNLVSFTTLNCNDSYYTDIHTACDSYTWINGVTYSESTNEPTFILENAEGCDSVVTLHLTITHSNTGIDTQIACNSYTWIDGITYTESTSEPIFILENADGCDSVVTLHLTINHSNTGIDTQIACDRYTWIDGETYSESTNEPTFTLTNTEGCDSVITLHLTINHSNTGIDTQIACGSYTWINGITYTESTTEPTFVLTNAEGCDSVVTLNLTIACTPTVLTSDAINITTTSATVRGSVSSNGGATITAKGFLYGTSASELTENIQINSSGIGSFSKSLVDLTHSTTYFYQAYATNSVGTAYGEVKSFTTQGAFTDTRDGNVYTIVEIGYQTWMAENLRYEGNISLGSGRYYPDNNASNVATYGYLYNWSVAMNGASSSSSNPSGVQGICPNGWHLPSDAEWTQLRNYLSLHSEYQCGGVNNQTAKSLASTTGWLNPSENCTIGTYQSNNNSTGFNAFPAGKYHIYIGNDNNTYYEYESLGGSTYFWSTTETSSSLFPGRFAQCMMLYFNFTYIDVGGIEKTDGVSVRCIRD